MGIDDKFMIRTEIAHIAETVDESLTGRIRISAPSAAAYASQPNCGRLQQEVKVETFRNGRLADLQYEWRDVPVHFENEG